jgi:hypothetical protein
MVLRAEVATIFTKRTEDGTVIKVMRENLPVTLPPIVVRTWTNEDGSVSKMFPKSGQTNAYDVATYYSGRVETNRTITRAAGPYHKDLFYIVEQAGGVAMTNRLLQFSEVSKDWERPLKIVDVHYEPPVAIYLYQPVREALINSPSISNS